jgi:membrane protease YdiL (CAAX protease family)
LDAEKQYDISSIFASPWRALTLGFVLLFICVMFSAVTGQMLMSWLGGPNADFEHLPIDRPGLYRFVQGLANLITWGLTATLWAAYTGGFRRQLGFGKRTWRGFFPLAALIVVVALPFVEWLLIDESVFHLPEALDGVEEWARDRENDTGGTIVALLDSTSPWVLLGNVVVFAAIPALAEEMFFRGFLLGTLKRSMGLHLAVWLSAVIFSLLHFQFLGFFSRIVLGALLGYFFVYSGSLWASIFAHFMHNLLNIGLAVMALRGVLPQRFLSGSLGFGTLLSLLSCALTLLLMYYFFRKANRIKSILQYE